MAKAAIDIRDEFVSAAPSFVKELLDGFEELRSFTDGEECGRANTMTLQAFINRNHIRSSAEWADDNPNIIDAVQGSSHWRVTLRYRRRQMTVPFSMGPALSHEPTAEDVLECLASDSAGVENARSFEDWCAEYGYDTDSRKAEKTFKACERQADKLQQLLGADLYDELLWKLER